VTTPLLIAALLGGCLVVACWRTRVRAWGLGAAVFIVAAAGLALTRSAEKIFPIGDIAVLEIYVRNAVSGRLLVGPYSRFGWHHPGPIYFYLLALVYRLAGSTTASLSAGAAVIATASIALLAWIGARSLGPRTSSVVLASVLVYLWRVPELAASAWNPHVVVLPAVALVVAAASAAGGDVALLPLVVVLASFIAQTDVALVPFVAVAALAATAGTISAGSRKTRSATLKSLGVAACVGAALWLVVVAEDITHSPGNLTLLWRFFVGAHGQGQSLAQAGGAWAVMLVSPAAPAISLAGGGTFETSRAGTSMGLAVVVLLALAAIGAWGRNSNRALARLAFVCAAVSLVSLWSATRIEDRIMDHEVFWISGIGALDLGVVAAAVAGPIWRLVSTEWVPFVSWGQLTHGTLVGACIAICLLQVDRARQGRLPVTATSTVVARMAQSVRQYLDQVHAARPLIKIGEDNWGLTAGVLLELDREGVRFAIEDNWLAMFPQSFAANRAEDAEVAFGNTDEHLQRSGLPGSVFIASFSSTYVDGLPGPAR
jgi:hypothetical protein